MEIKGLALSFTSMNNMFELGEKRGAKFFAIAVSVPGSEYPEIIINPMTNRSVKMDYYANSYHENLTHKNAPLRIVSYTYAKDLQELEHEFSHLFD